MTLALLLVGFWAMQVVATLLFKYGSGAPERWWYGMILGNVFGASSIWLLMRAYARLQPNLTLAVTAGGAFLLCQVALSLVFHARPTALQMVGIAAVGAGMVLAALGGPRE